MFHLIFSGPAISNSVKELGKSYKNARLALKSDMPEIIALKEKVTSILERRKALVAEVASSKDKLNKKLISETDYDLTIKNLSKEIAEIDENLGKLSASSSTFKHLLQAIEVPHIQVFYYYFHYQPLLSSQFSHSQY